VTRTADGKARDWLTKWLLGLESRRLTVLAAEVSADPATVAENEIAARRRTIGDDRREAEQNRRLFQIKRRGQDSNLRTSITRSRL
jgi:hypothetical protein